MTCVFSTEHVSNKNTFGIYEIVVSDIPTLQVPLGSFCINANMDPDIMPFIPVQYINIDVFDFMKMSLTESQCIESCDKFACSGRKINNACRCSNLIANAVKSHIKKCMRSQDCISKNPDVIPVIACDFRSFIQKQFCPVQTLITNKTNICTYNTTMNTNIDSCYITTNLCKYIVDYNVIFSTSVAVIFFICFILLIRELVAYESRNSNPQIIVVDSKDVTCDEH
jgi:hypothetical protein